MQGAAQRPGAHDRAARLGRFDVCFGRALHALADSPERAEIVLRLHGTEPGHHLLGRAKRPGYEPVGGHALTQAIRRHAGAAQSARSSSLIDVLARVCASTRFTITAQYSEYLPS